MSVENHEPYQEWLHLDEDAISSSQRQQLRAHLDTCPECRRDRVAVERLNRELAAARIDTAPRFRARVMGSLPTAGWESRHPRSWIVAAAIVVVLLGAATAATTGGGGGVPALWAAFGAITDLFGTSALAGAGLLAASWQGVGLAVREAMGGGATAPMVAFGLLILGLDVLFVRLLLRTRKRLRAAEQVGNRR